MRAEPMLNALTYVLTGGPVVIAGRFIGFRDDQSAEDRRSVESGW
jgi:hypothetical protein